jgi:hypothetical protein
MVQRDTRGLRQWPPSASLTFAVLPYFRSIYNGLYKHTFGDLERKWDKALMRKPREGDTGEDAQEQQGERNGILDIEVEIIDRRPRQEPIQEPVLEEMAQPVPDRVVPRAPVMAVQQEEEHVHQQAQAGQPPNLEPLAPGEGNRPNAGDWEFRQTVSTSQIATTIMGALFFPAMSSVMGDILKLTLPTKWISKSSTARGIQATGLLQEKWGRSVAGGCLFVVLKDALILYSKWRRAQNQGKMKVLDYDGPRRKPA